MREEHLNICFLYIEMILATPGAKLHKCFRSLRKNRSLSDMILLAIVLIPAGIILWQFRGINTFLLILAGTGLVTVFSFLFSLLRRHSDTVLAFGEMITYPFCSSYEQCRKLLDNMKTESFQNKNTKVDTDPFENSHCSEKEPVKNPGSAQDHSAQSHGSAKSDSSGKYDFNDEKHNDNRSDSRSSASNETGNRKNNTSQRTSEHTHRHYHTSTVNARLEEAKAFFGVDIPFTADEIKQRRNQLLKKYHPDNPDGSEEMCKKINECYALLIRYAA